MKPLLNDAAIEGLIAKMATALTLRPIQSPTRLLARLISRRTRARNWPSHIWYWWHETARGYRITLQPDGTVHLHAEGTVADLAEAAVLWGDSRDCDVLATLIRFFLSMEPRYRTEATTPIQTARPPKAAKDCDIDHLGLNASRVLPGRTYYLSRCVRCDYGWLGP